MLVIVFLLQSVVGRIVAQDVGHFSNPPTGGALLDFRENLAWTIGETHKVQWTSIYQNFTIALWQQDLGGGGGREGPAIFGEHTFIIFQ